jgi:hypothetical protein
MARHGTGKPRSALSCLSDCRDPEQPAYAGQRMADRNSYRAGNMDNGAGLIRAEWQQNKEDIERELAELRDWTHARARTTAPVTHPACPRGGPSRAPRPGSSDRMAKPAPIPAAQAEPLAAVEEMIAELTRLLDAERDRVLRRTYQAALDRLDARAYRLGEADSPPVPAPTAPKPPPRDPAPSPPPITLPLGAGDRSASRGGADGRGDRAGRRALHRCHARSDRHR